MTQLELQTGLGPLSEHDLRRGHGGTIKPFPLPHDATLEEFREGLRKLQTPRGGMPEEALFFAPELVEDQQPPWAVSSDRHTPWTTISKSLLENLTLEKKLLRFFPLCWLFSQDWWMYHSDSEHSGDAHGCCRLTSTSVGSLVRRSVVPVNNTIISIPVIVEGKIYIGTTSASSGGTLYKINLFTGAIERTFTVPFAGGGVWGSGIGASLAVTYGKVYTSTLDGKIYCLDATTLAFQWATDLRHPDPAHNQPVDNSNPGIACWTSPLVVNGKVYVGVGLGEAAPGLHPAAFGFVYCLDASSGNVIWLFCTNKFSDVADNNQNDIPSSLLSGTPPPPFTPHASTGEPPSRGASVWSSCVYSRDLNRIYVGTGNPNPDHPLPNEHYASGVLALDADTGQFHGFFQPDQADSYRPVNDLDVDMPSSPMLFWRGGTEVLGIGSKNGTFFLLDPNSMTRMGHRQLLPYRNDDPAQPLDSVDPDALSGPAENHSGVYGTAAVHYGLGYLFVGLGGWEDSANPSIDYTVTPFMRALRWDNSLIDAWLTGVSADQIRRYTTTQPPMYTTPMEIALSSPAVANDVVFVSTNKPALYAFDAATGLCLWSAPGLAEAPGTYNVGPAVYGDHVVIGCGAHVYIYTRRHVIHIPPWWWYQARQYPPLPPIPPPPPIILQDEAEEIG